MFFGATTWVFRWIPPYDKAIDQIAELGYKGIELTVWNHIPGCLEYYTSDTCEHLREKIAEKGMTLTSVFCCPDGAASADPAKRASFVEEFRKSAQIIKELGSPQACMCVSLPFELAAPREISRPTCQEWTVKIPVGLDFDQNFRDFIDSMTKAVRICEELGLRLALEPHPHRYMQNADSMLRILEHIDSPNLGMNVDPSHLFCAGEMPHIVIKRLKDRVFGVHFSDNDSQSNCHWRPGKGKVDWNLTMRALKEVGYNGAINFELEDVPGASGAPSMPIEPAEKITDCNWPSIRNEHELSEAFIRAICEKEGIELE